MSLGSLLGYQSLRSYLLFWLLAAMVWLASWNITARVFAPPTLPDAIIRAAVVAFAIVAGCGLVLGTAEQLTTRGFAAAEAVVLAASFALPRSAPLTFAREVHGAPSAIAVGIVAALMMFAVAYAAMHSPLTLYDSVSYHLFFAARWAQSHALSIIPTPFSDEAQAYAPANGEIVFAWLMLPFAGDLLARMGQFPFGLAAALTLYALARRLGAAPSHAIYPAAFFLLSRPVVEQIIGANVDLICAAMFLASLYLAIAAVDSDRRRDWILIGVSLGLYCGTKYLALVYLPVFLLVALARGPRVNMLWTLPGIAAFALPWYARNWFVAGSPIYPATLAIAGRVVARGAFTRDAMFNTVFHTTNMRLFPAMAAHAVGPALLVFALPFAIAGWFALAGRAWWPHRVVAAVPLLMLPLYWFGFPVNIDSRFLMPAVGPALLPLAFVFRNRRTWDGIVHVLYAGGLLWLIVGTHRELPATLPWFMGGWLALDGLIRSSFVPAFIASAVAFALVWRFGGDMRRWSVAGVVIIAMPASVALASGGERWCGAARCEYLNTTSPYIRSTFIAAWRWVAANITGSTIAYTGNNLPYPLTGDHLTNTVIYVNINGRPKWRFHDYDRAYRAGRFNPTPPLLATSSGELMPVAARTGPRDDAVRPRYERMEGIRDLWVASLKLHRVQYVFVSALSAYEIGYEWHNDRGFPIEDDWARDDPQTFQLAYENPQVRIYRIAPRGEAHT